MSESRHQCMIYEGPPSKQLPAIALKIQEELRDGFRCLYLNTAGMVAGLRSELAATGMDVAAEVEKGSLMLSSDSVLLPDGNFDVDAMLAQLESAVNQALADGFKGLFATGDMTWEFGSERNLSKLLEYENKLEQLFHRCPGLTGICQYHRDTLPAEAPRQALMTHQSIFINETLSRVNPHFLEDVPPSNSVLDETLAKITSVSN